MEITKNDLDAFVEWLKNDGLKVKKSERLWKKTILQNLLNDDEMTLDNYNDFINDRQAIKTKKVHNMSIDTFDYSIVLDKIFNIDNSKQKIIRYRDAGSMLHLFFESGADSLVEKERIRHAFERK